MMMESLGEGFLPVVLVGISAVGSLFACRKWVSRLAFFMLAPLVYLLLFLPVVAITCLLPIPDAFVYGIASLATLSLYIFNCVIFRNDGAEGVGLLQGLGGSGPGGRNGGGGDGGITPPSPITYRRFSLK